MASPKEGPTEHTSDTPDFILPRHGAIREDNWPEYEAKGFVPKIWGINFCQSLYGVEHVYTGDAFDFDEGRPLRHKPGTGIYIDPEGLAIGAKKMREHRQWLREQRSSQESEGGPSSN